MHDLVIIGAGGHGRETLDIVHAQNAVAPTWNFLGFIADDPDTHGRVQRLGTRILGGVALLDQPDSVLRDARFVIAVGNSTVRAELDDRMESLGRTAAVLVHPDATVGSDNTLAPGVIVAAGARITSNVTLGRHVHVNTNAVVSHDSRIGDYTSVSPGAVLTGSTTVGSHVFIGAGATTIPGCTIGDATTIGAGAVVTRDIPAKVTAVGVPATWTTAS